jgi:hypothetical protein
MDNWFRPAVRMKDSRLLVAPVVRSLSSREVKPKGPGDVQRVTTVTVRVNLHKLPYCYGKRINYLTTAYSTLLYSRLELDLLSRKCGMA